MRFEKLELYIMKDVGRDELNNPKQIPILYGTYKGKITPWTTEEIASLGRDVTRTQLKILTDAPENVLKGSDRISIDGRLFTIADTIKGNIRWRVVYVKEYFI